MTLLQDHWIIIAIAVAVIAALTVLIWLWWRVPKWQMQGRIFKSEKERADAEDNFRKTVGQALGGVAVLIGAGAAYLQFTQQQQASHDLLISNQVSKGFEQLASDKITMRLGGLYALEGVMNTPSDYHQPVLEALCALVRENTTKGVVNDKPATDIQAALVVVGRRIARSKEPIMAARLDDVNIPGAQLVEADLSYTDLTDVNLNGANLNRANLRSAFPVGAHLRGTFLMASNLTDALLWRADLNGADLRGADLKDADLTGADLSNAKNLDQAQFDQTCGRPKALPPGLALDKPCPPKPVAAPLNPGTTP